MNRLIIKLVLMLLVSGSACGQEYVFFLHNKFLEGAELTDVHPVYGKAEYKEIIQKFEKAGFTVISEKRVGKTDVRNYAGKVAYQIDSLLVKGIKPGNITVVGTSKGGYIAQYVSTFLNNPDINYVFVGAYRDSDLTEFPNINFSGNVLNIYEASDEYGVSAVKRKEASKYKVGHFKEIELHTGLKHGFLFKAMDEWIGPAIKWANGEYENEIPGSWLNCVKKSPNSVVKSNVCQTFNFNENGDGEVLLGDKLICKFRWKIENDLLKFSFDSSDDQSDFLSGLLEYSFTLYNFSDGKQLEIRPINIDVVYILVRKN